MKLGWDDHELGYINDSTLVVRVDLNWEFFSMLSAISSWSRYAVVLLLACGGQIASINLSESAEATIEGQSTLRDHRFSRFSGIFSDLQKWIFYNRQS